ncbi:GNAT family protein [Paenibacillus sp. YPG26]|uniref:GNAT family N-acetyltransferase n=1 Tax=Paenibacillus sp. YPG26 TaxID=2878915 RepID=UPI0020400F24|nr:GNAT family protein [Paenibacillus sp. YPG26]USB31932.1 GNAT family N-acetyltransferase [Paenibacillus sp. YPG26]
MFKHIIDECLSLKLLGIRDAARVFELTQQNREMLAEWLPWVVDTHSVSDSERYIQSQLDVFARGTGISCGIVYQGEIAGCISLMDINQANRTASIGYWLASAYQGKGLMTRSCQALIEYSFTELGLNRIEIRAGVGNQKSRSIPVRLGFTEEGVIRQAERNGERYNDHVVYGILASEWTLSCGS